MQAALPAPTLGTMLDRIGQTQAQLSATAALLLGLLVLALVVLPSWLVIRHVYTIAHEGAHALVGSSTGWQIDGVWVNRNGSGETARRSARATGNVMTSAAGYIGPSLFGLGAAKLISAGYVVAVLWLSLLSLAILLILIRNPFGILSVVSTGLVIYCVVRYTAIGTETVVAYLITWLLLLSGLRVVLEYDGSRGDAANLARATHIPRVLWIGFWLAGAITALVIGGRLLV